MSQTPLDHAEFKDHAQPDSRTSTQDPGPARGVESSIAKSRRAGSGFALSPVGDAGRAGLQGAEVGDELANLLVGERTAEVEAPGWHAGAGDAAGDQQPGLLVGGGRKELLGVQGGA